MQNLLKSTTALLFSISIFSQGNINSNIVGSSQQALIDLGNRSPRSLQPENIQGSHYFDQDFKLSKLEYFGKELNDSGFMRYNAFRDEIEMADTPGQSESDLILIKSKDVIPLIDGERYEYIPHRVEEGRAYIGYLIKIFEGNDNTLYLKRKKTFMEAVIARTSLENSFPPRYVESTDIYISINGDTPIPLKRTKNAITSFFRNNSDKIKKYIKSEKLRLSEDQSIVKIFEFAEDL